VTRGDIVVVATRGAYTSKPRPALIVQSDLFNPTHANLTVCPITSATVDATMFRISLFPGNRTGLAVQSQVMIDKVVSVPRASIGRTIGRCDANEIGAVDDALREWLSL
jgi:mRNA interferase MazF